MRSENQNVLTMTDQNLAVEHQIRPDALMGELGIKKDAYYAYLKHLGLKAKKDRDGKAYLEPEQANLLRELRVHVEKTGKMEGFERSKSEQDEAGALVQNLDSSELEQLISAAAGDDVNAEDIHRIIYGAGQLKAEEMMLHQAIQQELAAQMTYDDLPEELQTKVRAFRESSGPKFDPTQAASAVLGKWREIRQKQKATVQ